MSGRGRRKNRRAEDRWLAGDRGSHPRGGVGRKCSSSRVGARRKARTGVARVFGGRLSRGYIEGKSGLLFKTKKGTPLRAGNLRRRWLDKRLDDYGFHSFRRFRITHLEAVRAHGHLTKVWAGHSLGNDITAEYARSLKENLSLRLEEAEKTGTGFAVPAPTCSKISGAQAVAEAA